jgi:hypothetical protein
MSQEPYTSAGRVFVIVDNGSDHRGQAADLTHSRWPPIDRDGPARLPGGWEPPNPQTAHTAYDRFGWPAMSAPARSRLWFA